MMNPALILAAGKGSRMGGPKALMDCGGKPWWEVQLSRLHDARIESIWVVSPEVLATIGRLSPAHLIPSDSSKPMFDSIVAGLRALRAAPPTGVYILPIDVPASRDPATWKSLRSTSVPTVPTFKGRRGHPIFLPWTWILSTLDPAVAAATNTDSLRLDALLRGTALEIPVNDPVVVCNLNTPEDLNRFLVTPDPDARP